MLGVKDYFPVRAGGDAFPFNLSEWFERWEKICEGNTFYAVDVVSLLSWGFKGAGSGSKDARLRQEQRRFRIYMRILAGMVYEPGKGYGSRDDERLYWGTRGKIEREAWRVFFENVFEPVRLYAQDRYKPWPTVEDDKKSRKAGELPEWVFRWHYQKRAQEIMEWALTDESVPAILCFFHPEHGQHREWWINRLAAPRSNEDLGAVRFFRLILEALWSRWANKCLSLGVLAHARRTTYQWLKDKRRLDLLAYPLKNLYEEGTAWERLQIQRTKSSPELRLTARRRRMKLRKRTKKSLFVRGTLVRIDRSRLALPKEKRSSKKLWR